MELLPSNSLLFISSTFEMLPCLQFSTKARTKHFGFLSSLHYFCFWTNISGILISLKWNIDLIKLLLGLNKVTVTLHIFNKFCFSLHHSLPINLLHFFLILIFLKSIYIWLSLAVFLSLAFLVFCKMTLWCESTALVRVIYFLNKVYLLVL